ncbi:MAG: hypothetical protein NTZ50_11020 [Chloroflexi bacterium]|nr:hypothetical protein [Chloroflexota bacterium]
MSLRCVDCLNEAIEHCEVTDAALCADHLWYVDDGRRVSPRIAQQLRASGFIVESPQHYLAQLGPEFPPPRLPVAVPPRIRVMRNGYDLFGIVTLLLLPAAAAGAWSLATGGALWNVLLLVPSVSMAWAAHRWRHLATRPREASFMAKISLAATAILLLMAFAPLLLGVQRQTLSVTDLFTSYAPGPFPTSVP